MVLGDALSQRFGSNRRGEPMEFEWDKFPRIHYIGNSRWDDGGLKEEPEQFKGRIIFMSMYTDIAWWTPGNHENRMLQHIPKCSRKDVGHFWDLVVRKSGMELMSVSQMVNGTQRLRSWCSTPLRASILYFGSTSGLERGELGSKGGGKKSTHFIGSKHTVELILRAVISVNQLSIYGAVTDLCKELDADSRNQTEGEICESLVIPTESPNANTISQSLPSLARWGLLQEYERKFAERLDDQKLSKLCSDAGILQTNLHYNCRRIWGYADSMSRIHTTSTSQNIPTERVHSLEHEDRPSLGCEKSILTKDVIVLISCLNPCLKIKQFHGFVLWMGSINTSQKRQKKFPLRTFNCSQAQGDLLQRLSQDRNLLWIYPWKDMDRH